MDLLETYLKMDLFYFVFVSAAQVNMSHTHNDIGEVVIIVVVTMCFWLAIHRQSVVVVDRVTDLATYTDRV